MFQQCKQYVGARVNNLLSSSDGLALSIFCRKMEKPPPMREEMEERLFVSPQSRHFDFDVVSCKVFLTICTVTWRVNNYVSRQGKV